MSNLIAQRITRVAVSRKTYACDKCNKEIPKGSTYYRHEHVYRDWDEVFSWDFKYCARCQYRGAKHKERYEQFKPNCHHPVVVLEHKISNGLPVPMRDKCLVCDKSVDNVYSLEGRMYLNCDGWQKVRAT